MIISIDIYNKESAERKRLLCLDVGTKTIGLAVSDSSLSLATPLETIKRTKFTKDVAKMRSFMDEFDVTGFVIGMPVNMDGTPGPKAQSITDFGKNLEKLFPDMPIMFWDERLSTSASERIMIEEMDMSRRNRAKAIDSAAACWILQGALDYLSSKAP